MRLRQSRGRNMYLTGSHDALTKCASLQTLRYHEFSEITRAAPRATVTVTITSPFFLSITIIFITVAVIINVVFVIFFALAHGSHHPFTHKLSLRLLYKGNERY